MKYKVGDKVKVKSLEWYNTFSNNGNKYIRHDRAWFTKEMAEYCGKTAIVTGIYNDSYDLDIENKDWGWYDWMLEDEPTVSNQLKEKRFQAACSAMNGILSTEYSKPIPNDKIIQDRKSTRLNSSHSAKSRMPSSA